MRYSQSDRTNCDWVYGEGIWSRIIPRHPHKRRSSRKMRSWELGMRRRGFVVGVKRRIAGTTESIASSPADRGSRVAFLVFPIVAGPSTRHRGC